MLRISSFGLIALGAFWIGVAPALARAEFSGAGAAVFEVEAHLHGYDRSAAEDTHSHSRGRSGLPSLDGEDGSPKPLPGCSCGQVPESVALVAEALDPRLSQVAVPALSELGQSPRLPNVRSVRCRCAAFERVYPPFLQELAPLRI